MGAICSTQKNTETEWDTTKAECGKEWNGLKSYHAEKTGEGGGKSEIYLKAEELADELNVDDLYRIVVHHENGCARVFALKFMAGKCESEQDLKIYKQAKSHLVDDKTMIDTMDGCFVSPQSIKDIVANNSRYWQNSHK
eukprot:82965_1